MEYLRLFKRFVDKKPVTVEPKDVKANPEIWEFVETGASLDKAEPSVLKAVSTATMQYDRKVITQDEYQGILSSVAMGGEMVQQLTAFRDRLLKAGFKVEGTIVLSHSTSNGVDWLNARLYRQARKTAEEANADQDSVLFA